MFQLNNNDIQIDFRKYQVEPIDQIYLSFSPSEDESNTLNLKTEEMSIPNVQSFFTDHTNLFDQKVGYFQGQINQQDQFDYYLISKQELTKILKQLESLQKIKQNFQLFNQQVQSNNQNKFFKSQPQNQLQKSITIIQESDQKTKNIQQSQIMAEGLIHKDIISVKALVGHRENSIHFQNNKENLSGQINKENMSTQLNLQRTNSQQKSSQQIYSSVGKLNQPLPSRQRSQTHFNMKYIN